MPRDLLLAATPQAVGRRGPPPAPLRALSFESALRGRDMTRDAAPPQRAALIREGSEEGMGGSVTSGASGAFGLRDRQQSLSGFSDEGAGAGGPGSPERGAGAGGSQLAPVGEGGSSGVEGAEGAQECKQM